MAMLRRGCRSRAAVPTAYRATGAEAWMTHNIALLAGACEIVGQVEEAVTLLDEALQIAGKTGEHCARRS